MYSSIVSASFVLGLNFGVHFSGTTVRARLPTARIPIPAKSVAGKNDFARNSGCMVTSAIASPRGRAASGSASIDRPTWLSRGASRWTASAGE